MSTIEITDDTLIETMLEYGGGFVEALALAMRYADPENRQRIKDAFPEIIARYTELSKPRIP